MRSRHDDNNRTAAATDGFIPFGAAALIQLKNILSLIN